MSWIVGLTGSLATGKSTVASMFAALGAKIIDADVIARETIAPGGACEAAVIRLLGQGVLRDGRIDRGEVARIVFSAPDQLKNLEGIIHPVVRKEIRSLVRKFKADPKAKVIIIDVPLLFESGLDKETDLTVVVTARQEVQLKRVNRQTGMTKAEALRRIRRQMPLREKIRRADRTINNTGTFNQTKRQVNQIWQELSQKKKNQ